MRELREAMNAGELVAYIEAPACAGRGIALRHKGWHDVLLCVRCGELCATVHGCQRVHISAPGSRSV